MINVSWDELKAFIDKFSLSIQELELSNEYYLAAYRKPFFINTIVIKGTAAANDYETNYRANSDIDLSPFTQYGKIPKVSIYEPEGEFNSVASHDLTDRTTWYGDSVRISGEVLSLISGKTYGSNHTNWIDLSHGKLTKEDKISSSYLPKIYDSGVLLTEDVDYTINYVSGNVHLADQYSVSGSISADYSYENGSTFTLSPNSGKILKINHAEIQFSSDVLMTPIEFQVWVYNPYDLPNKVIIDKIVYKNEKDILNISNLGYRVPAFGALSKEILIFPFNYTRVLAMRDCDGAELRLVITDQDPYAGEFATATFYTSEENEI